MTDRLPFLSRVMRFLPARYRRPNIFGVLIAIAGAAIALRLVNVAAFALALQQDPAQDPPGITRSATAQDDEKAAPASLSDEDAPPLTQEDVNRAVAATAGELDGEMPAKKPAADAAAVGPKKSAETAPAAATPLPPEKTAAPAAAPDPEREFSAGEIDVLQSLAKRRDELDQRERNVSESAAMLKAAEKEVDRKLAELTSLKAEIEKLLGTQETMEEARIASLVKIYEAMKPKEAATIFNTLDADVLLSVVGRMNERRLSPILASMDPEKARMVTIRLAEQRQLPGAAKTDAAADAPTTPQLNLSPAGAPTP